LFTKKIQKMVQGGVKNSNSMSLKKKTYKEKPQRSIFSFHLTKTTFQNQKE
jgi:hypothetical protein